MNDDPTLAWSKLSASLDPIGLIAFTLARPLLHCKNDGQRASKAGWPVCWVRLLFAATFLVIAEPTVAQLATCRSVVHIDHYQRNALGAVELLLRGRYPLTQVEYQPASSAQRRPGQSEATRIAPEIVTKNPDIVLHGSTFSGSNNPRTELGRLIQIIDTSTSSVRAFVIYSSADLTAASLSLRPSDSSFRKLYFMNAPIINRFRSAPSAADLLRKLQALCEN
jgi:hypothetical protein